jgi:hypothetical protein
LFSVSQKSLLARNLVKVYIDFSNLTFIKIVFPLTTNSHDMFYL